MAERWRAVVGWPGYSVSDLGRVRGEERMVAHPAGGERRLPRRMLSTQISSGGYAVVSLCLGGAPKSVLIHRAVLEAFVGPCPLGMECRHLDGVKTNARLTNLEWGTPIENAADKEVHGTARRGESHGAAKLTTAAVQAILSDTRSQQRIADDYGVAQTTVSKIKQRRAWRHIGG